MLRLKQYEKGWIVERKVRYNIFFHKWVHYTHWTGLPDNPYYSKYAEKARDLALDQLKDEINFSFYHAVK